MEKVAQIFGFDEVQFRRLLAIYNVSKADDPYSILGVNQSASDEEVKLAYRQLTLENHPDKLVASGMPEEFVRQATEKMAAVNVAYSNIIQQRAEN